MEALFGNKIKISKERGKWKEVIINNKTLEDTNKNTAIINFLIFSL